MKKFSRGIPVAKTSAETSNPLWIITLMLAVFFTAAAVLVAWT